MASDKVPVVRATQPGMPAWKRRSEECGPKRSACVRDRLETYLGEQNERTVGREMGAGDWGECRNRRGAGARVGGGRREFGADRAAQGAIGTFGARDVCRA